MRIEVRKIKDRVIEIEEETPASSWDMDSSEVSFVGSVLAKCKFFRAGEEIVAEAAVTTQRKITCARCLSPAQQTVKQNFTKSYKLSELGEYLEINNDIREDILLNFPMKVLCREDCKGICPQCGANLNYQDCNCQTKPRLTERSEHEPVG